MATTKKTDTTADADQVSTDTAVDQVADVAVSADQVAAEPAPAEQDLTLYEFCQRLSSKDSRVELIAAFHYTETAAGTIKDVESAFNDRFAAFTTKPV